MLADWDFVLEALRLGEVGFIDGEPLAFWHRRPARLGAPKETVSTPETNTPAGTPFFGIDYLRADLETA